MDSEARRLRLADASSLEAASQSPTSGNSGAPSFVGKTTTVSSYPTAANKYFAIQPQAMTGTETEGATYTTASRSGTLYALNLGTVAPPAGTYVVCTYVPHRWVFRYDG